MAIVLIIYKVATEPSPCRLFEMFGPCRMVGNRFVIDLPVLLIRQGMLNEHRNQFGQGARRTATDSYDDKAKKIGICKM